MRWKIVTAPAAEPVTLSEAKTHLRVDGSDDDALIARLISAAREQCEQMIDGSVGTQTLRLVGESFAPEIALPRGPVQSVASVRYVDEAGVEQTIAGTNYSVDDSGVVAVLRPVPGYVWPTPRAQADAVRIDYVAGYASVPAALRSWILLAVGTMYAMRESDGDRPALPHNFSDRLLDRYRVHPL